MAPIGGFFSGPREEWGPRRATSVTTGNDAYGSGDKLPQQPPPSAVASDAASDVATGELARSAVQKLLIMAAIGSVIFAIWTASSGPHSVDTTLGPPLVAPPAEVQQAEIPANEPPADRETKQIKKK